MKLARITVFAFLGITALLISGTFLLAVSDSPIAITPSGECIDPSSDPPAACQTESYEEQTAPACAGVPVKPVVDTAVSSISAESGTCQAAGNAVAVVENVQIVDTAGAYIESSQVASPVCITTGNLVSGTVNVVSTCVGDSCEPMIISPAPGVSVTIDDGLALTAGNASIIIDLLPDSWTGT